VGTFVLNVCLLHPAVLAQDRAALDALSGGRLEIGLGAGWNKPEQDAIGILFEPVGDHIERLTEAIAILKGLLRRRAVLLLRGALRHHWPRVDAWSLTAAATEKKISWNREAAGGRFGELELNTYRSWTLSDSEPHPAGGAERSRADRLREQTGVELTVEEVLDSPHVFIGSIKDLTRKFVDLRERFGISSFLVDDLDALAPVVEELAGR
jgi:hypothetical protein